MKVLTLTQPWAQLVALGAKRIETRNWYTKYRGPLAIHAAKGFPLEAQYLCHREPFRSALSAYERLPIGKIIAVVKLVDVFSTNLDFRSRYKVGFLLTEIERAFGDYSPNRFGWILADARLLKNPIPTKGMLGLWEFKGEIPNE